MDREEIDNVICEIMYRDGPDRHIDGHDIITDFVVALLSSNGEAWADLYANNPNYKPRYLAHRSNRKR